MFTEVPMHPTQGTQQGQVLLISLHQCNHDRLEVLLEKMRRDSEQYSGPL